MTPISLQDVTEIAQKLLQKTEDGVLEWEVWDSDNSELRAAAGRFIYYLAPLRGADSAFRLQIWIDRALPNSEGAKSTKVAEFDALSSTHLGSFLRALHQLVNMRVLGISNLKNDILKDLE